MFNRRSLARRASAFLLALLPCLPALAATPYPNKPVRMVVAFAAGGPTDILARHVAAAMTKTLGQQVIVDNKPGAGGVLGTREVALAKADGYTLLFAGDAALTVLPQLAKNVNYDGSKNFTPIRLLTSQRNVLVANKSKGAADLKSFIDKARTKPDAVSYGSAGNGSPSHLIGALFASQSDLKLLHVAYKGAAPAMTDLLGGQVDAMFVGTPVALQNASRPELALLAITGDQRLDSLPSVPTFSELGIKGLGSETAIWWALMAPPDLPADIRGALDKATQAAMADPALRKSLQGHGVDILDQDATVLSQWIQRDTQKWGKLIRDMNITE